MVLVLLIGLAFAARVASLTAQGLWRDEVDALLFATAPLQEVLTSFTRPGWNGPFYFLLLRAWVALAGQSAFALRYLSLLLGVLTVPLIYVLGKRRLGQTAGLFAAVLAACAPYQVWYAQEVKMYTLLPFLALLALYALDRACETPRAAWWGAALVATSLAFYSHILAALLVPVACGWFLLHPRRDPRAWVGGGVVLALLTLPYLPLLGWQLPLLLQGEQNTGYPAYTLSQMAFILLNGWSTGIGGWGGLWVIRGCGLVAFVGAAYLLLASKAREAGQLLIWLLLPLAAIWLVSLRRPLFTDRYLIWSALAFYLLIGAALAALPGRWRALGLVALAGMLTVDGVNVYRQAAYPIKPQFREATAFLVGQQQPGDVFLFQIPYNRRVVAYYAPGLGPVLEAPFTNWRATDGGYQVGAGYVAEQLRALLADADGLWLVYSEVALWDDRELVKAWLDLHGQLDAEAHFHMVDLYHYRLSDAP